MRITTRTLSYTTADGLTCKVICACLKRRQTSFPACW